MTELRIEQRHIALHASAEFVRLDALRETWLGLISRKNADNFDKDLLHDMTVKFLNSQERSLVYINHMKQLISDNPEAFQKIDDLISNTGALERHESEIEGLNWRSVSQSRGGISNLATEQMDRLTASITNERPLVQNFLDGMIAGDIQDVAFPRGAGFACGFMIGATIGLAAGGPVGIMLAVEMGGAAMFTCFS